MHSQDSVGRFQPKGWKSMGILALLAAGAVFAALLGWSEFMQWRANRAGQQAADRVAAFDRSPQGLQRNAVRQGLFDPTSAQFRGERQIAGGHGWCGEVNAKNRVGAYVGFRRYVATVPVGKESSGPWFVRTAENFGREAFDDWWKLNCAQ